MVLTIVGWVVGAVGLLFGTYCYMGYRRLAHQCQQARIAIAYKGKVKIHAPLMEVLLWYRVMLKDKQHPGGRVIYHVGGTRIALTRPVKPERGRQIVRSGGSKARAGTWSAEDHTHGE